MTQPQWPTWAPEPGPSQITIFSSAGARYIVDNQGKQDTALDFLRQMLVAIQNAQDPAAFNTRLEVLQEEISALTTAVETLIDLQTKPVRGTITVSTRQKPMALAVHPSDHLVASVAWENKAGGVVPESSPTTWSALDATGVAFAGAIMQPGSDDQHEDVTFSDVALTGAFFLHAFMGTTTPLEAVLEEIDVSPDNTPTQGVIQVALG